MLYLHALVSAALLPADDFACWERYDLVRLTCKESVSNGAQKRQVYQKFGELLEAGNAQAGYRLLDSRLSVLNLYNVRSQFRTGKASGGLGRLDTTDMVGLFAANTFKPNVTTIPIHTMQVSVFHLLKFDLWLKEGEEGYWWVRRGAAKLTEGEDDWAVVTDNRELAVLVPFPNLTGPFADTGRNAPHERRILPTEKECKEWVEGVTAILGERDDTARRKKLLGYLCSENEILASWSVHALTRMSADSATEKAVRGLLEDPERSPLVTVTADRYLTRHVSRDWSRSAERKTVLARALRQPNLTDRQIEEVARYLILQVEPEVVMDTLSDALKVSDQEFAVRTGVRQGLEVASGLLSKAKPPAERTDAIDARIVANFYRQLSGEDYPKLVRERAQTLLDNPILKK